MRGRVWLTVLMLGLAACGTDADATAPTTAPPTTAAPATTVVQGAGLDLSGLGFEVHQEPG